MFSLPFLRTGKRKSFQAMTQKLRDGHFHGTSDQVREAVLLYDVTHLLQDVLVLELREMNSSQGFTVGQTDTEHHLGGSLL